MKCEISINAKALKKYLKRDMSEDEFAAFCKDAVISKLWEKQITSPQSTLSPKLYNDTKKG